MGAPGAPARWWCWRRSLGSLSAEGQPRKSPGLGVNQDLQCCDQLTHCCSLQCPQLQTAGDFWDSLLWRPAGEKGLLVPARSRASLPAPWRMGERLRSPQAPGKRPGPSSLHPGSAPCPGSLQDSSTGCPRPGELCAPSGGPARACSGVTGETHRFSQGHTAMWWPQPRVQASVTSTCCSRS